MLVRQIISENNGTNVRRCEESLYLVIPTARPDNLFQDLIRKGTLEGYNRRQARVEDPEFC
jgi:hypothetical protein